MDPSVRVFGSFAGLEEKEELSFVPRDTRFAIPAPIAVRRSFAGVRLPSGGVFQFGEAPARVAEVTVNVDYLTPNVARAHVTIRAGDVIDGDTFNIPCPACSAGYESVRMIGIEAPEMGHYERSGEYVVDPQPYAEAAKQVLVDSIQNKEIRLEYDKDERDFYDRLLAYVYAEMGGEWVLVNAEMVSRGLAKLLFIVPNTRYADHLRAVEQGAQQAGRGIWGSDELQQDD